MRILIAMSGGIDSSVVAHLLREAGHDVIGVRFTLWTDPLAPALAEILPSKCCNAQTVARAGYVSKQLAIPLHVVDLQDEFEREVVRPFLDDHRKGLTPNPCIRCNRTIKFGKLLELMRQFDCEQLATGHYARVARERLADGSERQLLLEATDASKDQSYYLYGLTQEQLRCALFPLGTMLKRDVYSLAKHFGVPLDDYYRESQDLCFFPEKTPEKFLQRYLRGALVPGDIVRRDGKILGRHDGLPLYTLGQRKGLGIGGLSIPLEVVGKDMERHRLIVAEQGSERSHDIDLIDVRWVSWIPPEGEPAPFECRTRSLSPRVRGTLTHGRGRGRFTLETALGPQAPGQSLVLYRGEEVIGGGVIV